MWSLILKWMKFWEKDKLNINLYIGVEQMIKWNSNVFNIFSLFFVEIRFKSGDNLHDGTFLEW